VERRPPGFVERWSAILKDVEKKKVCLLRCHVPPKRKKRNRFGGTNQFFPAARRKKKTSRKGGKENGGVSTYPSEEKQT